MAATKLAEAMERNLPVVREAWLSDSIEKQEAQPLDSNDIVSDISVSGRGIPLYRQNETEEALETITAELKIFRKRGVHKDTKLQDQGGEILEKNGIVYNCAFVVSDRGRGVNDPCIVQLVVVPENRLYMYYKRGMIGDDAAAEEKLDECENIDDAIK